MQGSRAPLVAFTAFTLIAGLNFVAVRFSNRELDPFWGACLRFLLAGFLFLVVALVRRSQFPTGRALVGALLYGLLSFAASYALAYYALVRAPAATAALLIALTPIATLVLASVQGLERITRSKLAGALVAVAGVGVVFWDQLDARVPALSLLALALMPILLAESAIVIKKFPKVDPFAMNAVAMLSGAALLAVLSFVVGERWALPREAGPRIALVYLVIVGSVTMFFLFLFVLARWSASATSYQTVLSPVVTVAAGALLAGEEPGILLLAGGILVLAGVYVGALRGASAAPRPLSNPSQDAGP